MHPHMGEMMWFMRINSWHHSVAIARGPHPSLHHASFELRGIDEYMRGTGRLLRAGVEKIWGPGRHLAGNNTFSYFLDPHGNTVEYTTELEQLDEDTWHPHMYDFTQPEVSRPVGHRERDERVRRRASRSTTPTRASSSLPRSDVTRWIRHLGDRRARHRRRRRRATGCTPCRRDARCSTWSAPGCRPPSRRAPTALVGAGRAAGRRPAAAAAGRADRAGLRRVRGARRGRAWPASTAAPACRAGVVPGTDVLLHQPVRAGRRARRRPGPAGLAAARLRARGGRRRRHATGPR